MGRQSARLYFQGYDHSGIAMADKDFPVLYNHAKMYKGNKLLWERMPASVVAVRNNTGPNLYDEGSYISTSDDLEHFSVIQYGISIPKVSARYVKKPAISQIITFAGHYVCSYSYIDTLKNQTFHLLLRSKDGYAWKTIEDFYTSNIGWIGKQIIDGEECLAVLDTGLSGRLNTDIIAFYYDSKFIRKKYTILTNVVGKLQINQVFGYDTLFIYYNSVTYDRYYKISVQNGIKVREERLDSDDIILEKRARPNFYNYSDDSLYAIGRSESGNLAIYKLGFKGELLTERTYNVGVVLTPRIIPEFCYSDKNSIIIQVLNYDNLNYEKESTIFIKIKNDELVSRIEHPFHHIYTSNGVSLMQNIYRFLMTDNIFGESFKDIELKGLDIWYNRVAGGFKQFAYLKRN